MKFAIDRLSLLRPLGHVSSVVERRNTIPILANIVMRADAGQLSLTATDMEMDIAEQISCSVQQEGACTVPAHLFYDIVRQARVAAGLSSIDAAHCYDSIAHAIASLVFQAFGVPIEAIESMLTALENMKYFLEFLKTFF